MPKAGPSEHRHRAHRPGRHCGSRHRPQQPPARPRQDDKDSLVDDHANRAQQPPPRWANQATHSRVPPPKTGQINICRPHQQRYASQANARRAVMNRPEPAPLPASPRRSKPATSPPPHCDRPNPSADDARRPCSRLRRHPALGARPHEHPAQINDHPPPASGTERPATFRTNSQTRAHTALTTFKTSGRSPPGHRPGKRP
jgi:hypothetical protein